MSDDQDALRSSAPSLAEDLLLGRETDYPQVYTPSLLCPIPRAAARESAGIALDPLPFRGEDLWTAYELSWLDDRGRPRFCAARITVPATSPNIVESKSLKLYLGSFAQTRFRQPNEVSSTISGDLTLAFRAPVLVDLLPASQIELYSGPLPGHCLDDEAVDINRYERDPGLLRVDSGGATVKDSLYTHTFRSLCPVTNQPDWATVAIQYVGPQIDRASLYAYCVSFRQHTGFHEATVEQMFKDLLTLCECERLSIWARFLRRGGIDINPFRSNWDDSPPKFRLPAQ
ncbi:MAG: NADPH-dependent 7-cyano-7-deazaguanine reductase QueF [Pseudomonadota bacterium]